MRVRTFRWAAVIVVAAPLLAALWWINDTFVVRDNLRVASPDLYRSGQLLSSRWQGSFDEAKFRTVINLRGAKPDSGWYRNEMKFAADRGLAHYDFPLLAHQAPSIDEMKQVVQIMREAPKPILIHCKNGSDRSGLVAALYRYAIEGVPADVAGQQLSFWYGHFPWLLSESGAMDTAFKRYVAADQAENAAPAKPL